MQNMIELKEAEEKVILAAVSLSEEGADASLDELEELARTAGASVCGRVVQKRESVHPGSDGLDL